jgi:hypothetical protein
MSEQNVAHDDNGGRTLDADCTTKNAEQTEELEPRSSERQRVSRPVGRGGWSAWGTTLVT